MQHKFYKKVILVILDGFGVAPAAHGNAIAQGKMPTLNFLVANFPALTLQASGPLVGLPWGEMGNSEVGHLNIGAGRIVGQDLPRVTNAVQNGEFFKNPVFLEAVEHAKKNNSNLHLMGMVSGGGVHSFDEHLYALLSLAAEKALNRVYIHMFTDGRDTDYKAGIESLKKLEEKIKRIGVGQIATIAGRFYSMDRGGHWAQTILTYNTLVNGRGETAQSAQACITNNYQAQIFDEMIKPTVILNPEGQPTAKISSNDSVIFFNFRSDRALQLAQSFVSAQSLPEEFRQPPLQNLYFATMTEYSPELTEAHAAFARQTLNNNLAEVISKSGRTQFHIAESEKYAHVTAFFNCGRTEKYPGEERQIVTSPENSHNYSDHPEMSAVELTDSLVEKITQTQTNFFLANFANTDMVGHTGNLVAGIKAAEFIDLCLKKILDAALQTDAALIITADHGNIEQMINTKTGDIDKDHTTNPVPFLIASNEFKLQKAEGELSYVSLSARVPAGVISDIAPTILDLFGLPKPPQMTGINLMQVL